MKRVLLAAGAALAALVLYLLAWPVDVHPAAWSPPPAPGFTGAFAPNGSLAGAEWLGGAAEGVVGPEACAIDAAGRIYTGVEDGRIVRFPAGGGAGAPETVARTGGRPLGLAFDAAGELIVADARKGLLAVAAASADAPVRTLASGHAGVPFKFADDLAIARDGTIYFSDASTRFGQDRYIDEMIEHGATGRLLVYRPATGATEVVLSGLSFANGVALAPDESYVLVAETAGYRVLRHWLAGPRRGTTEPLIENLPGFPDNVTPAPGRDLYWVALGAPRDRTLDGLAPRPFLRRAVARLPEVLRPKPVHRAIALGIDSAGRVVHSLHDDSPGAYAPMTSVREHAGFLYLGSFSAPGLGRVKAP